MPVNVLNTTVIDNNLKLQNITGANGSYDTFLPRVVEIANVIDFNAPMMSKFMTSGVTFSESNKALGKVAMLLLDTSSDQHTPNFSSNIKWSTGTTPDWTQYQHWQIVLQCADSTTVRATAIGFTSLIPPASMTSSFSIPAGWETQKASSGIQPSFHEEFCDIFITHESSNSRIKVQFKDGGSQTTARIYNVYINYTGLNNITSIEAMYNVNYQSCDGFCYVGSFGPTPVSDGYNPATYYNIGSGITFGWMAKVDPNFAPNRTEVRASLTDDNALMIKVVDSVEGTFFASCPGGVGTFINLISATSPEAVFF